MKLDEAISRLITCTSREIDRRRQKGDHQIADTFREATDIAIKFVEIIRDREWAKGD